MLDGRVSGRVVWLAGLLFVSAAVTGCGGPSLPAELPASSPASSRAEAAPLPELGSSFEDTPLSEEETTPMDHSMHGGMRHGGMQHGPSDRAGAGAPEQEDSGAQGEQSHPHGGH